MTDPQTPEAMLAALIEAQVQGRHIVHQPAITRISRVNGDRVWIRNELARSGETATQVLEILLDPEGLRAAYGEERDRRYAPLFGSEGVTLTSSMPKWKFAARQILTAWLGKPEGDTEAAIRTAFELLPVHE